MTRPIIEALNWDAVRYLPGSEPLITLVTKPAAERRTAGDSAVVTITLRDTRGREILNLKKPLKIGAVFDQKIPFHLHAPAHDFLGYFVSIIIKSTRGILRDRASGAFDAASRWNGFRVTILLTVTMLWRVKRLRQRALILPLIDAKPYSGTMSIGSIINLTQIPRDGPTP